MIKEIVNETIDIPDNALVFLDHSILIEIITRKRLELLRYIDKYKPKSIQELSELTNRKKQAVDRDIKILERHELIELKKQGRTAMPILKRRFIMLDLFEFQNKVKNIQITHANLD